MSINTSFLQTKFNLEVNGINEKILNIHWSPILHKDPTKTRFIITACK